MSSASVSLDMEVGIPSLFYRLSLANFNNKMLFEWSYYLFFLTKGFRISYHDNCTTL